MKIVKPSAVLVSITAMAEQLIEDCGRVCYKSEDRITDDSAHAFIATIMHNGHESVIEHAVATFRIVCDRGVSHEIVRHRIASYSQESTRYCNYAKDRFGGEISVIEPPGLTGEQRKCWHEAAQDAEYAYLNMIARGCSPQIARSVLPLCTKTEIVMTANMREWRHFLMLRTSKRAHPQMIEIAEMIGWQLAERCPTLFGEWRKR